ncbi:Hypothetical_protein [Hexamita inflata]|uniref:Hypothetical_protein n=1 Tax=Hexamita inflata TaxID=28002 RepID=A0AA86RUR5_9EUKA|nr:Hypothetical protein HINF_LOCUS65889 [Hexamita inflata]
MGLFNYSDIIVFNCYVKDIQIDAQSMLGEGISSGIISVAQKYNVVNISNAEITFSFIYCNSRYPKAGGLVGIGFYGLVDVKYSYVRNTAIQSSDELYQNQTTPYYLMQMWGLACGFLAQYYNSNIKILQVELTDSIISVNCSNISSSSGITSQLLKTYLNISQIIIQNAIVYSYSKDMQSFAAGIGGYQSGNSSYLDTIRIIKSNITSISYILSYVSGINAYLQSMNETILDIQVQGTYLNSTNIDIQIGKGISNIGSIYGFVQSSNTTTINCKISTTNIQGYNNEAIYMGGLVGYYSYTNSTLVDSSVTDCNLSANTQSKDTVVGGVVGYYVRSNVTIFDTNVSNLILQSFTVAGVHCSSLIAAALAFGSNSLIIQNSNVYSITILYSGTNVHVNFFVNYQTKLLTQIQTAVINSQSLGFSTINGIAVTNCQFQIRNDTINYQINYDGC